MLQGHYRQVFFRGWCCTVTIYRQVCNTVTIGIMRWCMSVSSFRYTVETVNTFRMAIIIYSTELEGLPSRPCVLCCISIDRPWVLPAQVACLDHRVSNPTLGSSFCSKNVSNCSTSSRGKKLPRLLFHAPLDFSWVSLLSEPHTDVKKFCRFVN